MTTQAQAATAPPAPVRTRRAPVVEADLFLVLVSLSEGVAALTAQMEHVGAALVAVQATLARPVVSERVVLVGIAATILLVGIAAGAAVTLQVAGLSASVAP